jgi:hypothetical protein
MSIAMEEVLVVLRNLKHENQAFCEFVVHLQTNQALPLWDVFQQHNPNQRSHGLAHVTNLMAHIQNFEVLSTKCV